MYFKIYLDFYENNSYRYDRIKKVYIYVNVIQKSFIRVKNARVAYGCFGGLIRLILFVKGLIILVISILCVQVKVLDGLPLHSALSIHHVSEGHGRHIQSPYHAVVEQHGNHFN